MRDAKRLYKIYDEIRNIHSNLPDWRTGQFILNFLNWHYNKYKTDFFYLEDNIFVLRLNEFINDMIGGNK